MRLEQNSLITQIFKVSRTQGHPTYRTLLDVVYYKCKNKYIQIIQIINLKLKRTGLRRYQNTLKMDLQVCACDFGSCDGYNRPKLKAEQDPST